MSKNVFWVVARFPQTLKSTFLKFFLTPLAPSERLRSKKFQTTLILAFEANGALSHENETKIVKIIHSACSYTYISLDFAPFCRQVSSVFLPKKPSFVISCCLQQLFHLHNNYAISSPLSLMLTFFITRHSDLNSRMLNNLEYKIDIVLI